MNASLTQHFQKPKVAEKRRHQERGKGIKIMIMVDAKGLLVAADSTNASTHENQLVQKLFQFIADDRLPERLLGDKAYDSDPLDRDLPKS
ncbi:MAG: hypothetical protein C5B47_01560 [Verrucomicrobia bacterium]|nr:MAG: hypothetical protein C5B47_01560 [Verrucomicrobiota bacterium]